MTLSNKAFIDTVFGRLANGSFPYVASFTVPPDTASDTAWKGWAYGAPRSDHSGRIHKPKRNNYVAISSFRPDKQGRVLIPPRLREYASLDGEVVVTGLNTYIEVWGPESWGEERERVEGDDANIEEWAALGI